MYGALFTLFYNLNLCVDMRIRLVSLFYIEEARYKNFRIKIT